MSFYSQSSLRQRQLVQASLILQPARGAAGDCRKVRKARRVSEAAFRIPIPAVSLDISRDSEDAPALLPTSVCRSSVDIGIVAAPSYKSLPVHDFASALPAVVPQSPSPRRPSFTHLLRKRFSGKKRPDSVVKCKARICTVLPHNQALLLPQPRKRLSALHKPTAYEPLSRRKSRSHCSSQGSFSTDKSFIAKT